MILITSYANRVPLDFSIDKSNGTFVYVFSIGSDFLTVTVPVDIDITSDYILDYYLDRATVFLLNGKFQVVDTSSLHAVDRTYVRSLIEGYNKNLGVRIGSTPSGSWFNIGEYWFCKPEFDRLGRLVNFEFGALYENDSYILVSSDKLFDVVTEYNRTIDKNFKFNEGSIDTKSMKLFDSLFQYLSSVGSRGRVCVFTNMQGKPYVNARFVNRVTGEVVIPRSGEYTDPGNFMGSHLTYEKDSNGKIIGSHSDWTFEYDYQLDKDGRIVADNTKPNKAGFEDLVYTKFVR